MKADNERLEVINVRLEIALSQEDIDDIMCCALEEGINYWCSEAEVVGRYLGEYASEQISRGGRLKLHDREEDKTYILSKKKFIKGLRKYIVTGNTGCIYWKTDGIGFYTGNLSIDAGDIDALAADCIIQYAVIGDVIYG